MPELPISSLASLLFVLERKGGKTGRKGKNPRWQIERFSATGSTDFMPFCTAAAAALGGGGEEGEKSYVVPSDADKRKYKRIVCCFPMQIFL